MQYAYVLCAKGTVEAKTPDKEMRFRNGRRHRTKMNVAIAIMEYRCEKMCEPESLSLDIIVTMRGGCRAVVVVARAFPPS